MARTTKGRIYTRTSKKHGKVYWLDFTVKGKRFRHKLAHPNGDPITRKKDAEVEADRIIAPYLAKSETERRRRAADALRAAEEVAEAAEEAARPKLLLSDTWGKYPYDHTSRGKLKNGSRKRRKLSKRTVTDNKSHWNKFVKWYADTHKAPCCVDGVTAEDGEHFSAYLRQDLGLTNNRHNKILLTVGVVLRQATGENPLADVDLYDEQEQTVSHVDLEPAEVLKAINATDGELRRLLLIGAFTGLRLGDACQLTWEDNVRFPKGEPPEIARRTSKSGAYVRFPVHEWLLQDLLMTPKADRQGPLCPAYASRYLNGNQSNVSAKVSKVLRGLDMTTRRDREHGQRRAALRSFHSLRHTFATICADYGVPLERVQEWLGHSTVQVTRIYQQRRKARDGGKVLGALTEAFAGEELPAFVEPAATDPAERRDRDRFRVLADTLPIEQIRAFLADR